MRHEKRKHSLRYIMVMPLCLFLFGAWAVICAFSYVQLNSIIEKKTQESIRYALSQRMLVLNKRLSDMVSSLQSVTSIAQDESWSYLHNVSYYQRAESLEKLNDVVDLQAVWRDNTTMILDMGNQAFIVGSTYLTKEATQNMVAALNPMSAKNGYTFYHPIRFSRDYHLLMTFDFTVGPIGRRQKLTSAVITGETVDELLNGTLTDTEPNTLYSGRAYLTDAQGTPLDYQESAAGSYIRTMSAPNDYGVCLCYEISPDIYYAERNAAILKMTLVFAALLVFVIVIASYIVRRIRRPLVQITDTIKSLQVGNPLDDARLTYTGITDFDLILTHVTEADQRIRQGIETVMMLEKEKHSKEVMLLRMQINPHFLYNALNAVQWMARCNDMQNIEKYMKSLLSILHYNLDEHGDHMVPLAKEVTIMQDYIRIHQFRYGNELACRVIGDMNQPVMVPRFILQPLVENAIYHGLHNNDGRIELEIQRKADRLFLSVRDNGSGIALDVLHSIHQGKKQGMGIGIRYVKAILEESGGTLDIHNMIDKEGKICGTEAVIQLGIVSCRPAEGENITLPLC